MKNVDMNKLESHKKRITSTMKIAIIITLIAIGTSVGSFFRSNHDQQQKNNDIAELSVYFEQHQEVMPLFDDILKNHLRVKNIEKYLTFLKKKEETYDYRYKMLTQNLLIPQKMIELGFYKKEDIPSIEELLEVDKQELAEVNNIVKDCQEKQYQENQKLKTNKQNLEMAENKLLELVRNTPEISHLERMVPLMIETAKMDYVFGK